MGETQPRKSNVDMITDALVLLEGRYGTREMCDIWGTDAHTYVTIMQAQVEGLPVLNQLSPGLIPERYIDALRQTANLDAVNPAYVRQLEATGQHDVVAINTAWGEAADKITPGSSSVTNFLRTSADSTETAKAMRCKRSFEVLVDSVENLRDIALEKSVEWLDDPYMDQTHFYDALPTVAGRPFSFYAEMLQSDLRFITFVYANSLFAKWADATGNHHSATTVGIDGMKLQQEYAKRLGLRCMTAPAQIPGREFNADVMYALVRTSGTLANMGRYIRKGRGDDAGVFALKKPGKAKGSSAMPHKDIKGGNPIAEEQAGSLLHEMAGKLMTAVNTIPFDYGRDLEGSASDRLDVGPAFKFVDHVTRRIAEVVYYLTLDKARSLDRINRTYGVVTAEQVMTYLLDPRLAKEPMSRKVAHDLLGDLAKQSYDGKTPFFEVLAGNPEISSRIDAETLLRITDPIKYIGQSKEIIKRNHYGLHGRKTFSSHTL
ncbi:MAG: lyase family protein [Candidatus Aenigmatarchaeota archaeon]